MIARVAAVYHFQHSEIMRMPYRWFFGCYVQHLDEVVATRQLETLGAMAPMFSESHSMRKQIKGLENRAMGKAHRDATSGKEQMERMTDAQIAAMAMSPLASAVTIHKVVR